MSTLTYWTGSVENDISGSTPFGIYDGILPSNRMHQDTKLVARRLGIQS